VLSLSPIKLLVVVIVALLVVGPDKLPQIARQLGAAWKTFRGFTTRVEEEVRSTMPDLPSTGDIARFARSPVALLDSLAKLDDTELEPDPGAHPTPATDHLVTDPGAPVPRAASTPKVDLPTTPRTEGSPGGVDPSLN